MALQKTLVVLTVFFYVISCSTDNSNNKQTNNEPTGKELSQICGSCHQYPEPSLLDKESWKKHMLPRMGYVMGIYDSANSREGLLGSGEKRKILEAVNMFPKDPLVNDESWAKIKAFYIANAPNQLTGAATKSINNTLTNFKVHKPELKLSPPGSSLVKIMPDKTIFLGDIHSQQLYRLDQNLNVLQAGVVKKGAVSIAQNNGYNWLTVMGEFSPSDLPQGFILKYPNNQKGEAGVPIKDLRRPVHASYYDFNGDEILDIVVSEFGEWAGRLSLHLGNSDGTYLSSVLLNQTGATRTEIHDFNNDGLADIMALFAQGNESIYIFYNNGNGSFRKERVLQFSPSNGSSYFKLFDYDGDSHMDIIYTSGDNADFIPVMKPYHGIYIFKNDGANNFVQEFFYHLNGAFGAIPADFDLDGDMDIAAISFFPDYENSPEESFVFLENDGKLNFKASSFEGSTDGRWIVMDAGDLDHDGDLDLILGSLAFEVVPKNNLVQKWTKSGLPFIYLENLAKP